MGYIQRPYDSTGIGDPYTIVLIKCINGREYMSNELRSHGLEGFICDVHLTARVDIPPETDRKFIIEHLTKNVRHIRIIGKYFVN